MGRRYGRDDGMITLLIFFIMAIVAMPIVGGYVLLTGQDSGSKMLGGALLVVGIAVWCSMGLL